MVARFAGHVFDTNVENNMYTRKSVLRPAAVRLLTILFVTASLFFGATGFIGIAQKQDQRYINRNAENFVQQYNSIMSHNLIVDTGELRCLALNIYWESRSEPLKGQLAVAGVTMNRVHSDKFPNTICGVVQHSRSIRKHSCQFSWWCDGKRDDPEELSAWRNAQQLARLFLAGIYQDPTANALWYHADYVTPDWADKMERTAKIGHHIFYRAENTHMAARS